MNSWTWQQFKNFLLSNLNYQYLFRGQADYKWKLIPSLYRTWNNINLDIYVKNIIPEIHNILVSKWGYESYNLGDVYSFNSFLAKLQHHGFPTPLLDWSYNPYIAAFFALTDRKNLGKYFSIYIFDYTKWITKYPQPIDLLNPNLFISTFLPNNYNNERAKIQQSIFTITNVLEIEAHLIQIGQQDNVDYLYKINISADEIPIIEEDLKNMGITEEKIFPNLDKICMDMKMQFFNY